MNHHDQQLRAIESHSDQAATFSSRYAALESDPYSSCFGYSRHRLHALLGQLLPPPPRGASLLDVGCGTGHHMAWARSLGFEVKGVDGSAAMLDEARRLNPGVEFRLAQVDTLPFQTAEFDSVLCIEVLRYLPDAGPCIGELARVLKPGGTCLVTASPLLNISLFPFLNRVGLQLPLPGVLPLKQFFHTSSGLRRRFAAEGFESVSIQGVYFGALNWVERVTPRALPRILRALEPWDRALSSLPVARDLSGMLLVHAVR